MKALIWKELRENIVWALLAMLALGAAQINALYYARNPGQDFLYTDGITLCKKSFLTVTMFGYAAAGLALGLLQVLPELKRDRWAALLHLPLPRGRFYWGKAIAGLILYFIAAGLPFLFAVWQAARPGNFPTPFVPKMIAPGLADFATGLCYYFAALLVALQWGRVALRALPLFAALHVSFFAFQEPLFRVAVESALAMTLVLSVAGWGALHARESLRARPWLGRIAFLIIAFYGACGAGDLLKAIGGVAGHRGESKYSSWETLDDGAPARVDEVENVIVSVTDVHGQPLAKPNDLDRIRSHTLFITEACSYVGDSHGWRPTFYPRGYRESDTYLVATRPYSHPRLEQWFYIFENPHYVGMQHLEKREFARLGMDGIAPPGAKVRAFPEDVSSDQIGSETLVIAAPESLRFVHLPKREITPVSLPAPGPICGLCHTWTMAFNGTVALEGIALGSGMAVYNAEARLVAMLPYHHDVDRWGCLSLGALMTKDRFFLKYEPSAWINERTRKSMPSYAEVVDKKGTVLTSYEIPPLPENVNPPAWNSFLAQRLESPAFFFGEMLYRRIGAAVGSSRLREALQKQIGPGFSSTLQAGQILVLIALVLSAITFVWSRRAEFPARRAWAWTAGVFLLGLPGFILFWLAGERPRTVPCAACQRPRKIESERCDHCGAPWPVKPADGTEILDRPPLPL